jgi:hypothetical protein
MTSIIRCSCKHETQDAMYGAGNRMANELRNGQLRCTVCGNVCGSVFVAPPTVTELAKQQAPSKKEKVKNIKPKMNKDKKFGRK